MKRSRAQQPKVVEAEPQDPSAATANPKPQRRAKQPRQPKAAGGGKTKAGGVGARVAAAAAASAASAAAANAGSAASSSSSSLGAPETAPTVPDVCVGGGGGGDGDGDARAVEWDHLDDDAGMHAAAAWWTWGVDEEKVLGWFPFVEEDFRCAGGRAGDAEVAAFDHDIWSIW